MGMVYRWLDSTQKLGGAMGSVAGKVINTGKSWGEKRRLGKTDGSELELLELPLLFLLEAWS